MTEWMELETINAKWNRQVGKRQIPYCLTYNQNLMKKLTNKKNRTRDRETWNRLTVTRGEGDMGVKKDKLERRGRE